MGQFRVKLDNVVKSLPIDWDQFTKAIERVEALKGQNSTWELPGQFTGSSYDYLKAQFDADFTDEVDIVIEYRCSDFDAWVTEFTGKIFLSACQFNLHRCMVQTFIEDNGFIARIKNNQGIKVFPNTGVSKNGVSITASTNQDISIFDMSDVLATYSVTNVEAYTVFDIFTTLVEFMSDGEVDFGSTLFDAGGTHEGICITTGQALRDQSELHTPQVSFAELFRELDKKLNLVWYMDYSAATPKLWVEEWDDAFVNTNLLTLRNLKDLVHSVNDERLFANIVIGSENVFDTTRSITDEYPASAFYSYLEEEYFIEGTTNTGTELNLLSEYVIDTNVFQDIVENSYAGYDEYIFIVQTDLPANARATKFDLIDINSDPYAYNGDLRNSDVLPRWDNIIYANIGLALGTATGENFEATRSATTTHILSFVATLWDYDTVVTDPGGNYDNTAGNYKYTAPVDGYYAFVAEQQLVVTGAPSTDFVRIDVRRYNAAAVFQESHIVVEILAGSTTMVNNTEPFYMAATDYAVVYIEYFHNSLSVDFVGGNFQTLVLPTFDAGDSFVQRYEFTTSLSKTDFDTIEANPLRKLTINEGSDVANDKEAYIEKMQYNLVNHTATFTLIGSIN